MGQRSRADIRRSIHSRIRKKIRGTSELPRLAVFRSLNHIYAQVINDDNGKTLASASTVEKSLKVKSGGNIDAATQIGKAIAERTLSAGIDQVVFDRGGYIYHGRVKALLDATREAGLNKNELAVSKASGKKGDAATEEKKVDKKKSEPKKAKAPAKKKTAAKKDTKKETKKDSKGKTDKKPVEKAKESEKENNE